ncbi:hypothetical protein E2C01_002640 [Portunus trituberculatus]|uniref:Uncharacterized protein n=1 Tax=Portunus trituberculatus TaxID=210409 RepID=A0A5B7CLA5_PORTR|nr:hypothetical protein [Portunus trituberculatus]
MNHHEPMGEVHRQLFRSHSRKQEKKINQIVVASNTKGLLYCSNRTRGPRWCRVQGRGLAPDMLIKIQRWTQPIILLTHKECSATDLYSWNMYRSF